MPIHVVCTGCRQAFTVSDQFAGKKGPCPKCKAIITVPALKEQVVVHAPDEGPKSAEGRPIFKPISRVETNLTPIQIFGIAAGVVGALLLALVVRFGSKGSTPPAALLALGAIVLGPVLALAAYTFLRDQEGEPYRGVPLLVRSLACGLVYAVLWGVFAFFPSWVGMEHPLELMWLVMIVPVMVVAGALACFASLDLEWGTSAIHYGFYLTVTVVLLAIAGGIGMIAPLPKPKVRPGVPRRTTWVRPVEPFPEQTLGSAARA